MRIALFSIVAIALASANLGTRQPSPIQKSDPPGKQICDATCRGISNWGLNGALKPPATANAPLKKMPLGLGVPQPKSKPDPSVKTGVTRVPGQPLGPQKCRPCNRKRQLCCGGAPTKEILETNNGRPVHRTARIRVTRAVAKAAAFSLLVPPARNLLEEIKQWDNPIGYAVKWLDDAIAALQEAIGGPQRYDIDGNDLKAKLICALKGGKADDIIAGRKNKICLPMADEFKEDLERDFQDGKLDELIETCKDETYSGGDPYSWEWFTRRCAALRRTNEYAERIWQMGLDELLSLCSDLGNNPAQSQDGQANLEKRCTALQAEVYKVEVAAKLPPYWARKVTEGGCKCFCAGAGAVAGVPVPEGGGTGRS
ncbi:Heat-labile enterotoxin IIA, A chain [Beauveria brongniartii RCEF 3172]|uniref:Heat-labile enterotoxin IIA, A chain n=1 Tax=Beauveria brongniartii RCEF 3172 TaxID=1081107 RepID=A0A167ICB4_9HYPO|nr:Heat-labile enterotoxin IIA, A chain [Beauveria brongniartii RCEF 3172]